MVFRLNSLFILIITGNLLAMQKDGLPELDYTTPKQARTEAKKIFRAAQNNWKVFYANNRLHFTERNLELIKARLSKLADHWDCATIGGTKRSRKSAPWAAGALGSLIGTWCGVAISKGYFEDKPHWPSLLAMIGIGAVGGTTTLWCGYKYYSNQNYYSVENRRKRHDDRSLHLANLRGYFENIRSVNHQEES